MLVLHNSKKEDSIEIVVIRVNCLAKFGEV